MYDSIEYKKQVIKDIKKVLENKGLSLTTKMGLLSEIKALEASISLTGRVKRGNWVILTAKNMYYQFDRIKLNGVTLLRNGVPSHVNSVDFNNNYRLATPNETKQHVNFLRMKVLKSVDYGMSVKVKADEKMVGYGSTKSFLLDPMKCDFYMVTCTGLHGSKVRHATYPEAEKEAIRIAKKRNHEAWIVGVVASVKPVTETVSNTKVVIKKR